MQSTWEGSGSQIADEEKQVPSSSFQLKEFNANYCLSGKLHWLYGSHILGKGSYHCTAT